MDCVDLKESVMEDCAAIALRCGFTGMHFQAGDVSKYAPAHPVHLLISLHACDTATDLVLDRGVALGAKVILSTPLLPPATEPGIKLSAPVLYLPVPCFEIQIL